MRVLRPAPGFGPAREVFRPESLRREGRVRDAGIVPDRTPARLWQFPDAAQREAVRRPGNYVCSDWQRN